MFILSKSLKMLYKVINKLLLKQFKNIERTFFYKNLTSKFKKTYYEVKIVDID